MRGGVNIIKKNDDESWMKAPQKDNLNQKKFRKCNNAQRKVKRKKK